MPDKRLEIEVEIAQLRETVAKLQEATAATAKGSEANKENSKSVIELVEHTRGFHRVLHGITEQSPLAGLALHAAFSGPGAAVAALILAVHALKKAEEEQRKAAEEAAAESSKAYWEAAAGAAKAADEVYKARLAHDEWVRSMTDGSKKVRQELDLNIEKMKAETKAVEEINKAQGKATHVGLEGEAEAFLTQQAIDKLVAQRAALGPEPSGAGTAGRVSRAEDLERFAKEQQAAADAVGKDIAQKKSPSFFKDMFSTPGEREKLDKIVEEEEANQKKFAEASKKASDEAARLRAEQTAADEATKRWREQVKALTEQIDELQRKLVGTKATTAIGQVGAAMAGKEGVDAVTKTLVAGAGAKMGSDEVKALATMLKALHEESLFPSIRASVNDVQKLAEIAALLHADQRRISAEVARLAAQIKGTHAP